MLRKEIQKLGSSYRGQITFDSVPLRPEVVKSKGKKVCYSLKARFQTVMNLPDVLKYDSYFVA